MNENPRTILLVEDEPVTAIVERKTLEAHGYRVTIAESGERAVELALGSSEIDLILMDIDLGPGIDGTLAAQEILRSRSVPIVFLTSHTEQETVAKVKGISGYGYVVKESGGFVLLQSISIALQLFEAHRHLAAESEQRRDAAERLRMISENIVDMVALVDMTGTRLYVTESHRQLGYEPAGLIGRSVFDLVHPKDLPPIQQKLAEISRSGETAFVEFRMRFADGNYRWCESSGKVVFDDEGRPQFAVVCARDISSRKMMEQKQRDSEARYRVLADLTLEGLVIHRQGVAVDVNPALCRISGYEEHELIGNGVYRLFHPADLPMIREKVSKASMERYEARLMHKDGRVVPVEIEARNITVSGEDLRVGAIRDITHRKEAERALEAQVAETHAVLKEVQHRIKNNFATVEGFVSLQIDSVQNPETIAALNDVLSRVRSIRVLYEKLLTTQTGESVSAHGYLGGLIDEISAAHAGERAPRIDFEIQDVPLCADRAFAVGVILTELLTNAMKYAFVGRSETGTIRVRFTVTADCATLSVSDDGVGFAPDITPDTTDSFGLMLVRLFAEQLRGSISITSKPDSGTEAVLSWVYVPPSDPGSG
ncbi:MAG: PAS domain S-box protein [Spirochaetaceae bacterium]|nr:MAG: PAS domain S-box protein [Spirochaetaceae bacterium]